MILKLLLTCLVILSVLVFIIRFFINGTVLKSLGQWEAIVVEIALLDTISIIVLVFIYIWSEI